MTFDLPLKKDKLDLGIYLICVMWNTVEAGYNKVGYTEVPDIAKRILGPGQNPLCDCKFV